MKQISVTYKDPEVNGLVKSSVTVELNEDELEFVLRGLRSIHAYAAQNCGLAGQTPIEDCRLISDLYYALKY